MPTLLDAAGITYKIALRQFTPLQSSALDAAAASLETTPMQVALARLLQRSPNILLIPGTSSVEHLRENLQAATLQLPREVVAQLTSIGRVLSSDGIVPLSAGLVTKSRLVERDGG